MKSLFFGGIHPADKKSLSAGDAPISMLQPKQVSILMSQHIGTPCKPLVRVGEWVKKGQKVGDGEGMCVPVHASVSGKVVAVEPRRHPGGKEIMAVVIENDFKDTPDETMSPCTDYHTLDLDHLLGMIREAGIVGMGGATFSTQVKAASSMEKVGTLIANGCECEPYLTADDTLLRWDFDKILEGMRIIAHVLKPERMVLAVEENKKEAIAGLKKALEKEGDIELNVFPTRFPQGAEKQLIQAVTGREVPPGQLPASVGCAVFNVATFAATYDAVCKGKAVTDRIVTVSGEGVKEPKNFRVPIGTTYEDLLKEAGGILEETCKIITGGPMMGYAQEDLSTVTIKGTNGVLGLVEAGEDTDYACIRCGKCITVCPMNLQPLHLFEQAKKWNRKGLEHYYLADCIECGCCSYSCPGNVPLTISFKQAKIRLREEA